MFFQDNHTPLTVSAQYDVAKFMICDWREIRVSELSFIYFKISEKKRNFKNV